MEKGRVPVLAGAGGRGVGRRKEGLLGGGRDWTVEDIGKEKVEVVDGEEGESCSDPEQEEQEPKTNTDEESGREARGMKQRVRRRAEGLEPVHTGSPHPTDLASAGKTGKTKRRINRNVKGSDLNQY